MFKILKKENKSAGQSQEENRKVKTGRNRTKLHKRGALAVIGGLLLSSAVIRVGIGATEVIAATNTQNEDIFGTDGNQNDAPHLRNSASNPQACVTEEDIGPLLKALQTREARIEEQEKEIVFRTKTLEAAKNEAERRIDALETAEKALSATIAKAATAAEDDLSQLTAVYEQMKPKQAAALFEEMDPNFAAGFLGRMRPESASSILAGMSPNAAYSVSVVLAGRNADVPTD